MQSIAQAIANSGTKSQGLNSKLISVQLYI